MPNLIQCSERDRKFKLRQCGQMTKCGITTHILAFGRNIILKGNLTIVVCIFDASREQKGAREQKEVKKKLQAIYPLNVINLNSTLNLSTLSWTTAAANDHAQVTYIYTHTLQSHMQTLYLSLMLVAVKRGEKGE